MLINVYAQIKVDLQLPVFISAIQPNIERAVQIQSVILQHKENYKSIHTIGGF